MKLCKFAEEYWSFALTGTIRVTAQMLLCYNFSWNGDNENAAKEAQNLPGFWTCKEAIISKFLNGDDLVHTTQETIAQFADAIRLQLWELADANYVKGVHWTNSERIAILDKGNKILNIIYDNGDYHFYNVYLSTTYRVMAALSLLDKKIEETLDMLGQERYDVIRSDERFIKMVEKLKEYAN